MCNCWLTSHSLSHLQSQVHETFQWSMIFAVGGSYWTTCY